MKEHIETVREALRLTMRSTDVHLAALDALAKIEAEHERVTAELADSRRDALTESEWCRGEIAALRARVEQLTTTLRELRCETLDMEPDAWGIRCIEDHNAIIDEALAAPEQKEPAQPPAPMWRPIETAPTDGTPVLIWAPEWKFANCGWWQDSINIGNDPGWTDGTVISWNYQENAVLLPTHWMPLPSPPAAALLSRIPEGE